MSQFTPAIFEEAVARYFGPIASKHKLPLIRRDDHAYEMPSAHCVLRVDYHQGGHTRSMNVVLISPGNDPDKLGNIGVWAIAGYNGSEFKYIPWKQTAEGFFQEAEFMANLTHKYCIPYLLGQKHDWSAVLEYWKLEGEKELEKIKGYKLPPSVQKRWHLPKT